MGSKFIQLNTYGDSKNIAFESLCIQLFEKWIYREYPSKVEYFTSVLGDGGDGGVEAYATVMIDRIIGLQAKWFPTKIGPNEINQIKKSIDTALSIRKGKLVKYIVCIPKRPSSSKFTKAGGQKKVTANTEDDRIKELLVTYKRKAPKLQIEFWDEIRLLTELAQSGNEGINKFWFEREVVSFDRLRDQFDRAKVTWLKEKYLPALHQEGKIQSWIGNLLFNKEFRRERLGLVNRVIRETSKTIKLAEDYRTLNSDEIAKDLEGVILNLQMCLDNLINLRVAIESANDSFKSAQVTDGGVWKVLMKIEERIVPNTQRDFNQRFAKALQRTHQNSLERIAHDIANDFRFFSLVILGDAGTGKTHALAYAMDRQFKKGSPGIIVQAKTCPCNSWLRILQEIVPDCSTWSETEILNALEAIAATIDVNKVMENFGSSSMVNEPTKFLICIDGIEENFKDHESWRERISEAEIIVKKFPRIRLVFSCRSHSIDQNPLDISFSALTRRENIFDDGDVPIEKLVPVYLRNKNIDISAVPWVIKMFDNALALKLFSEEFENVKLSDKKPFATNVGRLIELKIKKIKIEFLKKYNLDFSRNEVVIEKAFSAIFDLFTKKTEIEHDEIVDLIVNQCAGLLDRVLAGNFLDTLCDYGIISSWQKQKENHALLDEYLVVYTIPYQSYIDFYLAQSVSKDIFLSGSREFPKLLEGKGYVIELAAISLLSDYDIWVGHDNYWINGLDVSVLDYFRYKALQFCPDSVFEKYLPEVGQIFAGSIEGRQSILINVVLPNLYRQQVNVSYNLVHKALKNFSSVYERDLLWSGPDFSNGSYDERVSSVLQMAFLAGNERCDELPLILAWSLSCVDSKYREECKTRLCGWAVKNVSEFVKLLDIIFFCGDPLIKEELACVMLGIASSIRTSHAGLNDLSSWVIENIFSKDNSNQQRNIIVRHCARMVVERAVMLKERSKDVLINVRPPYSADPQLLTLDTERPEPCSDRRVRFPITGDLAWYVVERCYRGFMDRYRDTGLEEDVRALLREYETKYGKEFTVGDFALSAIIAFLKELGWKKDSHSTHWTEARHGLKSDVYTFVEKYTWCAVHDILGYLADRLPYGRISETPEMVEDYMQLTRISNPAQYSYVDILEHLKRPKREIQWIVPTDIAPNLCYSESTLKEDVDRWVHSSDPVDFLKWISFKDTEKTRNWILLSGDTYLPENEGICSASLHIVNCYIDKDSFSPFISSFNVKNKITRFNHELNSLEDMHTYSGAFSAKDVVWMKWLDESHSEFDVTGFNGQSFTLYNSILNLTEVTFSEGERYLVMPSKLSREMFLVDDYDSDQYYDKDDGLVGWFNHIKESYICRQEGLYIDSETYFQALYSNHLEPVWFVSNARKLSPEAFQEHQEANNQNVKIWVVWKNGDGMKSILYHDAYFSNSDE